MLTELQLLIKPASADCNAGCRYCFYRRVGKLYPDSREHRMSDATLDGLVRRYLRLRLPHSMFCWQGGEPTLMGLDFYRRAVQLMQLHGRGQQSVSNALQTNGLLIDDEWAEFLTRYTFLVGLSLDGPPELHDAYRKAPGMGGSHAEVVRAMETFRRHGTEFNILAVVNDLTVRHAARIYRHFRELGVTHMQFIPCVEANADGSPAPFSVTPEAYADFLCELFDAWLPEAKSGISDRLFDALLAREVCGNTGLCNLDGRCGGYLVIEHNGDAYPCDFFVEEEWRLGNALVTPFEKLVERGRAREFRAARRQLPAECADCRWKTLCLGGCLKDRRRIGGRFDRPTWFCETHKRFFAHAAEPIRQLAIELRNGSRLAIDDD